jgi:hypothetical protein
MSANPIINRHRALCKRLPPVPDGVYAYVDTVAVWVSKKPRNSVLRSLKESCGHCHVQQGTAYWNKALRCRLTLNQPRTEALSLLDDVLTTSGMSFVINLVHLALDFTVRHSDEARLLMEHFNRHLVKKWHGKQRVRYAGREGDIPDLNQATRYTGPRHAQHNVVLYCDKPSRFTGEPCLHMEWRIFGKGAVEKLGVYDPQQLIDFDHRAFWQKHLCLEEPNFQMLGRQFLGRGCAKKVAVIDYAHGLGYKDRDLRVGNLIGRVASTRDTGPTAQDIRDWARGCAWFHPETSMMRLPVESYLPPGGPMIMY